MALSTLVGRVHHTGVPHCPTERFWFGFAWETGLQVVAVRQSVKQSFQSQHLDHSQSMLFSKKKSFRSVLTTLKKKKKKESRIKAHTFFPALVKSHFFSIFIVRITSRRAGLGFKMCSKSKAPSTFSSTDHRKVTSVS